MTGGTPRQKSDRFGSLTPELVVLVGLACVAGVVLRFVAASPMWLDEALTANIAELPPSEILDALRSDGHPPLYYLLSHYWGALVGQDWDAGLRALSGLFSVAAAVAVWFAGRRLGGRLLAWVAVAVFALSPLAVRYATENRMYALVMFEVALGWLLVDDLVRGRRRTWRVPALAVVAGALLWTHYWGMFLIGTTGLVVLARWWWVDRKERNAGGLWVVGAFAVGGVMFLPWVPSFLEQLSSTGTPWAEPARPSSSLGVLLGDFSAGRTGESLIVAALIGVLVVAALFTRPGGEPNDDPTEVVLDLRTVPGVRSEVAVTALTLGIGAGLGWLGGTVFQSRYGAVIVPLAVLVIAYGVVVVRHRVARVVLLVGLILGGSVATWFDLVTDRSQMGEVAAAIATDARPGDVVVYCPDQLGPAGDRALREAYGPSTDVPLLQVTVPTLEGPKFVDWVDYEERNEAVDPGAVGTAIVDLVPPDGQIYLVWNSGYRTYEGICEGVLDTLALEYPDVTELVVLDPGDYFEAAALFRLRR